MNRSYWFLVFAQWFNAFADNAVFFALVGLAGERGVLEPDQYMSGVQTAFLAAYILLAPVVGTLSDRSSRKRIIQLGVLLKMAGVLLLFSGIPVPLCYAIFGAGAVVYSPAKYGMLNDLIQDGQTLLRGNGILEGLSILAIMVGSITGGILADHSSTWGLFGTAMVLILSLLFSFGLPKIEGKKTITYAIGISNFFADIKTLFSNPLTRFALLGNSSFWMSATLMRIAYLTWLPVVLGITDKAGQATLLAASAVGVIGGAMLAPVIIKIGNVEKAIPFAYISALLIMLSPWVNGTIPVVGVLFMIGLLGGLFVVPMNTLLQSEGKKHIGVGRTVAIQNMMENVFMLSGLAVFQFLAWVGVSLNVRMMFGGAAMAIIVFTIGILVRRKKTFKVDVLGG